MKRQPFMQIRLIEESQKMEAWMGRTRTESTTTKSHTQRARHQQERTVSRCCGIVRVVRQHCNDACSRLLICISYVRLAFKMFGFHKPKMYRSLDGCCICRAKSSSSRFTDSKRYENDFTSCFGLCETRSGEICNACVLLVKRCKKLPVGSKKNWNHVVDARGGPSLKISSRPKKRKSLSKRAMPIQISRLQKELKRNNSDAHSTTSSASPAQSPSYSHPSDEGSDTELSPGSSRSPVFSFLDLTYWKRQKVCCGIIYKGRFGEVLIDPHLFKPCCRKKRQQQRQDEEVVEEVEVAEEVVVRKEDEVVRSNSQESSEVITTTSQTKVEVEEEDWRYCTTV